MSGSAATVSPTDLSGMMQAIIAQPAASSAAAPVASSAAAASSSSAAAVPATSAPASAGSVSATQGYTPVIDVGGSGPSYNPAAPIGVSGSEMAPSLVGGPGASAGGTPTMTAPKATAHAASSGVATTPAPSTDPTDLSGMMQSIIAAPPVAPTSSKSTGSGSQSTSDGSAPKGPAKLSGGIANLAAGGNEAAAGLAGMPVDLTTGALNLASRGIKAATGVNLGQIQNPVGGSQWWQGAMGLLGANPQNVQANGIGDQVARDIGSNVVGALLPAGVAGQFGRVADALDQAAPVARGVAQTMAAPSVAANAVAGLGAGVGQAAAQYAVPQQYSGLAGFIGQLAGGGLTALGESAATGLGSAARSRLQSFMQPMSSTGSILPRVASMAGADVRPQTYTADDGQTVTASPGQMERAQSILANAGGASPSDLAASVPTAADANLTPGVQLTPGQMSGNSNLMGFERTMRGTPKGRAAASDREANNNKARLNAINAMADPDVQAQTAGNYVQRVQQQIDQHSDAVIAAQEALARPAAEKAAGRETQSSAGSRIRSRVDAVQAPKEAAAQAAEEAGRGRFDRAMEGLPNALDGADAATRQAFMGRARDVVANAVQSLKSRTSAYYKAVDPDGKWALPVGALRDAARQLKGETSQELGVKSDPMVQHWLDAIDDAPHVVSFKALQVMRTKIGGQAKTAGVNGDAALARQLNILKSGIDKSIEDAVAAHVKVEAPHVVAGNVDQQGSMLGRLGQFEANDRGGVYTPTGRRIDVNHEVVEADSLVPSHNDRLEPNPNFPQELQPRDRGRVASELQIGNMARNLQPERLGASSTASDGAPIVGPDNLVESGNARVLAIRRAYQQNGPVAQAYRDHLAASGADVSGMKMPVLIRRRTTDLSPADRVAFTREANQSSGLSMGAAERAAMDAQGMSDASLSLYQPGDVTSAANRPFVTSVIRDLASHDPGAFGSAKGELSIEGAQRIRNAMLQRAYGDPELVRAVAEGGSEDIKAFGAALTDAAGSMARLRADIAAGRVDPAVDITPNLVEAARLVRMARGGDVPLSQVVGQRDAFDQIAPETERILQFAYGPNLSGRLTRVRFAAYLQHYADEAAKQETAPRMFGENANRGQLLQTVGDRYGASGGGEAEAEPSVSETARQGGGTDGPTVGRSADGQAGAGRASGGSRTVVGRAPAEPNITAQDAADYRKAMASKADQAKATAGLPDQLVQQGKGTPYKIADSAVGQRIWTNASTEDSQKLIGLVGQDQAEKLVGDYAALDLRATPNILQADGSLNPKAYQKWMTANADRLSLYPGLRARFSTAQKATNELDELKAQRAAIEQSNPLAKVNSDADVVAKYVKPGPQGGEAMRAYAQDTSNINPSNNRSLAHVDAVHSDLSDAIGSVFRDKVMPNGVIDSQKYRGFMQQYKEMFDAAPPSVRARFDTAAAAQETVDNARLAKVQAVKKYQDSAASHYLQKDGGVTDPQKAIDSLFRSNNPAASAAQLMRLMQTDTTGAASEGFRRNVIDYVMGKIRTTTEAGTTGEKQISKQALDKLVNDPRSAQAMQTILGQDRFDRLKAIADELDQEARGYNVGKVPATSQTHADSQGSAAHGHGGAHDPSVAVQLVALETGMELAGHAASFLLPHVGLAAMAGRLGAGIGAAVMNAGRSAGLEHVDDLLRAAVNNPEIFRLIMLHPTRAAGVGVKTKLAGLLANLSVSGYVTQPR